MNLFGSRWVSVVLCVLSVLVIPSSSIAATNPVPFLNPLVPSATAPGGSAFTLTVTGTGFVSGSVVLWNGSARTTTFVSSSKLTAAITAADIVHPTTATISVQSPAPGGGTSNSQYFQVAYSVGELFWTSQAVANNAPITTPMGAADFNNDGKLDMVCAVGGVVYVSLGNGDGTFQGARGTLGVTGTITGISVADVNGDGKLDVIISGAKNSTTSFVATMLGNGDSTFQPAFESDFSLRNLPARPVLADFNGDGALDLAFATATSVQTLLGNGDGTFRLGPASPLSQIGLAVPAVGDFNGDGKLDLVVTVYDPFTTGLEFVGVMQGVGDGSFGALAQVPGTSTAFSSGVTAAVADFNNDGKLDIATGIQTAGSSIQGFLLISLGNGDGTFGSPSSVPNVTAVTTPLLLGDFNGDGNLDLATGGFEYFGHGDGTFPTFQGSSSALPLVVAGDFKGTGELGFLNETQTTSGGTTLSNIGIYMQVPPQPDFTGIVSPFNSVLVPGHSASFTTTVQPLNGFTGDVVISVSNLPAGVSASYSPATVLGGSGSSTVTLTAASTVALGNYTLTLSGNSGSITHSTSVPLEVNDSIGDWTGYVSNSTQNIQPAGSATYKLVATAVGGFTGNISYTASGLPAGATATFNPPTITGGSGSTILTIQTSSTTPQPSISNIAVTGVNGILTHSVPVYLGVSASTGDFEGFLSPSSASVPSAGGTVTFTVTESPINGGAGDITLSASGLPPGATPSFAPGTIPGSNGSSTLTVTVPSGTPTGTYQVFVTAAGAGVIHQTSTYIVVIH
jgi:hypothetical protein